MPTHYDVLGVDASATAAEIKRAYHRQARLFHPDAHVASAAPVRGEAERAMQTLNLAWQVLRDPSRRRRYDRSLEKQQRATTGRGGRPLRGGPGGPGGGVRRSERFTLGSGFQTWLGAAGMPPPVEGRSVYNLRVKGTTDLSPLGALAPDRLVGLHAEGVPIGDDDLRHLKGMSGLRILNLSDTLVTDVGLVQLLGCERLDTLLLWDTAITDGGLDLIGRLVNLRQLGLGNTAVTDRGLASLASLRHLRLLQLWGTNVEGPGLEHLHGLAHLDTVSLPWRVRGRYRRRLRAALPSAAIVA